MPLQLAAVHDEELELVRHTSGRFRRTLRSDDASMHACMHHKNLNIVKYYPIFSANTNRIAKNHCTAQHTIQDAVCLTAIPLDGLESGMIRAVVHHVSCYGHGWQRRQAHMVSESFIEV